MCCCRINQLFFMSLPTAGVVIAWLSGTLSLIQSIFYIAVLARGDNFPPNFVGAHFEDHQSIVIRSGVAVVIAVKLTISLLDLLASIMILVGIKRNSHLMLLPWLINNIISLVMLFVCNFIMFAASIKVGTRGDSSLLVVSIILFVVLAIYCQIWRAIYSLFRHISENKDQLLGYDHHNTNATNYELFHSNEGNNEKRF